MARHDDAQKALWALYHHAQLLADACLENRGAIPETAENQQAIEQLRKHRLIFDLDEDRPYSQVSRVVSDLMHHVTQSYQRQVSNADVSGLVEELEHIASAYAAATRTGAQADRELREAQAQELVANLIDTLRQITQQFTGYILHQFSMVTDLDQRILENKRAITKAQDLNRLFDTLTPNYLAGLAGASDTLQYLLMKVLRRNLDRMRGDLVDATHGLRENLAKLEKDLDTRCYSSLIDVFLTHYERNPGYTPDPSLVEGAVNIPDVCATVAPMDLRAIANIEDASQAHSLEEIVSGVLRQKVASLNEEGEGAQAPTKVTDSRNDIVEEPQDPFDTALDNLFEALPHLLEVGPTSALEAYRLLDVEHPEEVWLLAVLQRLQTLMADMALVPPFELQAHEVERYSGNIEVSDIVFRKEEDACAA